jgi:hypothetical protein
VVWYGVKRCMIPGTTVIDGSKRFRLHAQRFTLIYNTLLDKSNLLNYIVYNLGSCKLLKYCISYDRELTYAYIYLDKTIDTTKKSKFDYMNIHPLYCTSRSSNIDDIISYITRNDTNPLMSDNVEFTPIDALIECNSSFEAHNKCIELGISTNNISLMNRKPNTIIEINVMIL